MYELAWIFIFIFWIVKWQNLVNKNTAQDTIIIMFKSNEKNLGFSVFAMVSEQVLAICFIHHVLIGLIQQTANGKTKKIAKWKNVFFWHSSGCSTHWLCDVLNLMKPWQTPVNKAPKPRGKRRNKERGHKQEPQGQNPKWVSQRGKGTNRLPEPPQYSLIYLGQNHISLNTHG